MASEPSIPLVRLILRAACLALLSLAPAASAAAAPVLVFDHGRVTREQDPFVPPQTGPIPPPPPTPAIARASLSRVQIVLRHMLERHDITQSNYDQRVKDYGDALFIRGQLAGTPRRELSAVIGALETFAAHGQPTPSRLASRIPCSTRRPPGPRRPSIMRLPWRLPAS